MSGIEILRKFSGHKTNSRFLSEVGKRRPFWERTKRWLCLPGSFSPIRLRCLYVLTGPVKRHKDDSERAIEKEDVLNAWMLYVVKLRKRRIPIECCSNQNMIGEDYALRDQW